MVFSWGRRKAAMAGGLKKQRRAAELEMDVAIPPHFRCPISLELMKDPVILCTGITYDRESIERWIEAENFSCPVTNRILTSFDQIPNHAIRRMIQDWCVQHRSHGVERIPTPRIPVTPYEVSEICSRITAATQRGDVNRTKELVRKIWSWGRESERNKRCVAGNGTGSVLAASFEYFSGASMEGDVELLEEILCVLTWTFPISSEAQKMLGSSSSLNSLASFLKGKDLSAKQNVVLVLKQLLSRDQIHGRKLAEIEGLIESLVSTLKDPHNLTATKTSLTAIYHLISQSESSEKIAEKFVELGLVSLLLELLVDSEKSLCEKYLAVIDRMCDFKQGRTQMYDNALAMPILMKKILRISETATELSISILWKLCKNGRKEEEEEEMMVEALQLGAFQKLLVILQVGCGERMKEKVTETLKLLNQYKGRIDCVDSSMDFKYLKHPA